MVDENSRPLRSESVAHRVIDGSAYLVDPNTTQVFALNEVASLVWAHCDGQQSLGDIAM